MALLEAGAPYDYGVVANISEGGACIWTSARLEPGRRMALRLSFPKASQPLETDCVVVWSQWDGRPSSGGLRYGFRWSDETAGHRERLARMIAASA